MTLNTILQVTSQCQAFPSDARGEWYLATDALEGRSVEELHAQNTSGAMVLGSRKGFWNGNLHKEEVELFLWGTPAQLELAQHTLKLQPSVDALLDRPELYWG